MLISTKSNIALNLAQHFVAFRNDMSQPPVISHSISGLKNTESRVSLIRIYHFRIFRQGYPFPRGRPPSPLRWGPAARNVDTARTTRRLTLAGKPYGRRATQSVGRVSQRSGKLARVATEKPRLYSFHPLRWRFPFSV